MSYDEFDEEEGPMFNEDSMPVPCQKCGNWFELTDGVGSEKWFPNTVICETCGDKEKKEIEYDEEIAQLKQEIEEAEYVIQVNNKRLDDIDKVYKPGE